MSTRSGNALGVFFMLVGVAACIAGYQREWASVFMGGLGVFGVAAFLLDSSAMKDALTGFRDSAGDLIPGRRAGDGSNVKVEVKKADPATGHDEGLL